MFFAVFFSRSALAGVISGLLEGVGIPWPGAVVLGAAGTEFSGLWAAVIIGTMFSVAYTLSSAVQYCLGRSCWHVMKRFVSAEVQDRLDDWMRKYGQAAVLWTRPLAVGNYISLPAGIMRMHVGKFLLYTFMGIWPWAFGMVLAGSVLHTYIHALSVWLPYLAGAMVVATLVSAGRSFWRRARVEQ